MSFRFNPCSPCCTTPSIYPAICLTAYKSIPLNLDMCPTLQGPTPLLHDFTNWFLNYSTKLKGWSTNVGSYSIFVDGTSGTMTVTCLSPSGQTVYSPTTVGSLDPNNPFVDYEGKTDFSGFCCGSGYTSEGFVFGVPSGYISPGEFAFKGNGLSYCFGPCIPSHFNEPLCFQLTVPGVDPNGNPILLMKTIPLFLEGWEFLGSGSIRNNNYVLSMSCPLWDATYTGTPQQITSGGWIIGLTTPDGNDSTFAWEWGSVVSPLEVGFTIANKQYTVALGPDCSNNMTNPYCAIDAYLNDTIYINFSNGQNGLECLNGVSVPLTRDVNGTQYNLQFWPTFTVNNRYGYTYISSCNCYLFCSVSPVVDYCAAPGTFSLSWQIIVTLAETATGGNPSSPNGGGNGFNTYSNYWTILPSLNVTGQGIMYTPNNAAIPPFHYGAGGPIDFTITE